MHTLARNMIVRPFAMLFALTLALVIAHGGARAQDRPATSQQQLDQMLAPIALYPDALLSQILMAATYPLEVVEAARWSRNHPNLVGDDAVRAAERENWDPSVKSLLAFPQVLARMDENPQWTQALGDAFLDQEPQVMDTVQQLRRRAQAAGNLRSDERQSVVANGPIVVVQPANPQIVHVPYYDPMVVYGPWWWPEYRPVYWRPFPGYYARPGFAAGFYWGPSIRISAGFFFGAFDWPHRQVRVVQVNNYYYKGATVVRRENVIRRENNVYVGRTIPGSDRRSDARTEVSRPAGRSAVQPAAQPAIQTAAHPVAQPRASADVRVERRDQANRVERGERSERLERHPEPRHAPATRLETPRAVEVHAAISHSQPEVHRIAVPRPDAPRNAEAQPRTPRAQPEARHEAGGQRGARAEDAARRPREQR